MTRLGRYVLIALAVIAAAWIALLALLPDAVRRPASVGGKVVEPTGAGIALQVPVVGVRREDLKDSWGDARENGLRQHHGTDVMAPANTPIVAAAPGVVEKLFQSAAGGTTIYVRSPARTWTYYYAHLSAYAPGLHEGQAVKAGEVIGYVGDTGDAGAGNFHLHFGLTRTTADQHWYEGTDVDPYPYLAGKRLPG